MTAFPAPEPAVLALLHGLAGRAANSRDFAEARAAVDAALACAPEWADLLSLKAHIDLAQGRLAEALATAQRAAQGGRGDLIVMVQASDILQKQGRVLQSRKLLEAVLSRDPSHVEAHDRLAWKAFILGDPEATIRHVQLAIEGGLTGRDHVAGWGVGAALLSADFAAARRMAGHVADAEWRASLERQCLAEEAAWTLGAAGMESAAPVGGWEAPIRAAEAAGDTVLGSVLIRQALRSGATSFAELEFIRHFADHFPDSGRMASWAAGAMYRRWPNQAASQWFVAETLMYAGAYPDAVDLLLGLSRSGFMPALTLRALTFCAAFGAMAPDQLLRVADALRPSLPDPALADYSAAFATGHRARQAPPGSTDQPLKEAWHRLRRSYRAPLYRKPHIALCLSGQLRGFEQAWAETRRALAGWDVTIFVATWADVGAGAGAQSVVDRLLPASMLDGVPASLRALDVFSAAFPICAAALRAGARVTAEGLREFFGTDHVEVADESAFETAHRGRPGMLFGGSLNQAKMFFSLHAAFEQRRRFEEAHGKVFDAVIRLRCDKGLLHLADEDVEKVLGTQKMLVDYCLIDGVSDQFGLMDSCTADLYAGIWPAFVRHGGPGWVPGGTGRFQEFLLAEHLIHEGVEFERLHGTRLTNTLSVQLPIERIGQLIAEDLAVGGPRSETQAIVAAACAAALAGAGPQHHALVEQLRGGAMPDQELAASR